MVRKHPITEVTRRRVFDFLSMDAVAWSGRIEEAAFLARLYTLKDLLSYDNRYRNAEGDIIQHRQNNHDWDDDWVFYDGRFQLQDGPPTVLLAFLAEMLHPVVRPDAEEVQRLLKNFNGFLAADGYELAQVDTISGIPCTPVGGEARFTATHPNLACKPAPASSPTPMFCSST